MASGRGDTGPNKVQGGVYEGLLPGNVVTLRAKARWLKGSSEILLRLRGNYLEAAGVLPVSAALGTPGARNSRWARNAPPAIYDVSHSPVLPAAGERVRVTARVRDPDGLAAVNLRYRFDPDTNVETLPMTDDGKLGDEVAGDGVYSAVLPGQPQGVLVAFYVRATDKVFPSASATFPSDAPERECLVRFGDPEIGGSFASYHIWLTDQTRTSWEARQQGSNEPLDVTFVYGRQRLIYNAGAYYHGSPWHWTGFSSPLGGNVAYNLVVPRDDRFLGEDELILMPPGNIGSDSAAQREQVFYWMEAELGLPSAHRRFIQLFLNGQQRSFVFEDAQRPGGPYLNQWYPNDPNGDLFKVMEWFEFPDPVGDHIGDFRMRDATLEKFITTGGRDEGGSLPLELAQAGGTRFRPRLWRLPPVGGRAEYG